MSHLPKITIQVIPNDAQRYPTCGDYFEENGNMEFRISASNDDYEMLIALHELIEWWLVTKKGVTIDEIDRFDKAFEANRKAGNVDEPGNDPKAPYWNEHQIATLIERQLAYFRGVDWTKYDDEINNL